MSSVIHETAIIYPGVELGDNSTVDAFSIVGNKDGTPVRIGDNARIGYHSLVRGSVTIGRNFKLGAMSSVEGTTTIGDDVTIHGKIEVPSVIIGNRVQIYIFSTFYDTPRPPDGPCLPPVIEDDVVLCSDVRILGGVTVGAGSHVCAGAFVKEDVPPDSFVKRSGEVVPRRHA